MSDEPAAKESAKPCSRCGQPDADGGGVWVDKADVLHEEWLCGWCVSRELAALHEQIMRYQADPQYDARFIEGQEKTEAMLREQHSADLREVAEMAIAKCEEKYLPAIQYMYNNSGFCAEMGCGCTASQIIAPVLWADMRKELFNVNDILREFREKKAKAASEQKECR